MSERKKREELPEGEVDEAASDRALDAVAREMGIEPVVIDTDYLDD